MGLRSNGFYATVWEVKKGKGNYMDVRLSTSKKDPAAEKGYRTDWNGFARFCGKAKDFAQGLSKEARIRVTSFEVTNYYSKEKDMTYTNVAVYEAETATFGNNGGNSAPAQKSALPDVAGDGFMNIPDDVEDGGLPFN